LAYHGAIPLQPEPLEVGQDGGFRSRTHPWPVEVIEPQQPAAIETADLQPAQKRRAEIAQMKDTARGRGKAAADALLAETPSLRESILQNGGKGDGGDQAKSGPPRPPNTGTTTG
jgi:hypothetical protein